MRKTDDRELLDVLECLIDTNFRLSSLDNVYCDTSGKSVSNEQVKSAHNKLKAKIRAREATG